MPPKKKAADKGSTAASSAPTPGSATDQAGEDLEESELSNNHEAVIEEFVSSGTVAMECLQDILGLTMERIRQRHIAINTDAYTANAACEALTDLTDWLYLTCEEDAKLEDFKTLEEPTCIELDAWAENASHAEQASFPMVKKSEVVDMYRSQMSLGEHIVGAHQAILPEWLREPSRPASSIIGTSLYSQTLLTPRHKNSKQNSSVSSSATKRMKSQLSQTSRAGKSQATTPTVQAKTSTTSQRKQSATSSTRLVDKNEAKSPSAQPPSSQKSISAGRMRQFRRRSEQHKAQKQQAVIQQKLAKGPSNRLEPIPNTFHSNTSNNLPSVQIIDPGQEALDARRKALRNGKVRPQTDSEIKLVGGAYKKHATSPSKKLSNDRKLSKVPSLRNAIDANTDKSAAQRSIAALPETLVDSLAISDGSLGASMLEQGVEDFDRLKPVSVTTTS